MLARHSPKGGRWGGSSLIEIGEHGLRQSNCFAPLAPPPLALFVWRAQFEPEGSRLALLSALHVTHLHHPDLGAVGLTEGWPIIPRKRELAMAQHRDRLHGFIRGRERFRLEVDIAGLLDYVGHRHKGVGIF